MKHFALLFVASVTCAPLEIINYEDAEAGHGHMMSGVPGEMVEGNFYWNAAEGDNIKLVYTAGEDGFMATGDHLPVSPQVPAAPQMVLPVMVDYTPEVAEARSSFMKVFDEIKMRQVEDNVVDDDAVAVEAVERRRRDADPLLINYPVVGSYAPSYSHYYVYPVQQKVVEEKKEDVMMNDEDDMEMEVMEKTQVTHPVYYAPSYPYYPMYPSLVYPQVSTEKKVVTSPVSVASVQVRYPQYYPQFYPVSSVQYPQYPGLVSSVVSTVSQPDQAPARVLPEQKQAGEDEPAALLL